MTFSDTLELGGFGGYTWKEWSALVEVRQGVNGHDGLISDLSFNYTGDISHAFYQEGPPLILSLGPEASLVDSKYSETYFGVNPQQSFHSGLPVYNANGGLLKYGVAATLIIPITYKISATMVAGFARLSGDAADSPLVTQRGTDRTLANMATGTSARMAGTTNSKNARRRNFVTEWRTAGSTVSESIEAYGSWLAGMCQTPA